MTLFRRLSRASSGLGAGLLRYQGFKCFMFLAMLGGLVVVLASSANVGALPAIPQFFDGLWWSFCGTYWTTHVWVSLLAAISLLALGPLDAIEPLFHRYVPQRASMAAEDHLDQRIARLNWVIFALVVVLVYVAVPVLHLVVHRWMRVVVVLGGAVAALVSYYATFVQPARQAQRRSLSSFTFSGPPAFDVASLGGEALEVRRELSQYRRVRANSPVSARVRRFIRNGGDGLAWSGLPHFFSTLSSFLEVRASEITLHENTTDALRHALAVVVDDSTTVVTTDMEYGSVNAVVDDLVPTERLARCDLRSRHLNSDARAETISGDICDKVSHVASSTTGRIVVLVSHVYYETGLTADLPALARRLAAIAPGRVVLIGDGAQAVGNTEVAESIQACHLYATSAHKWLLAVPTLGILVHNEQRLVSSGFDVDAVLAVRRPFARWDFDVETDYSKQTIDLEPLLSLNVMLQDLVQVRDSIAHHNRELASIFAKNATRLGAQVVTPGVTNGIVCIRLPDGDTVQEELESKHGLACQSMGDDLLRFSFHYYHGESDVNRLLSALQRVVRSRRNGRVWNRGPRS